MVSLAASQSRLAAAQALQLVEVALTSQDLDELAARVPPSLAGMALAPSALLYIADSRLSAPRFSQHGLPPEVSGHVRQVCSDELDQSSGRPGLQPFSVPLTLAAADMPVLLLVPLSSQDRCVGLMGLQVSEPARSTAEAFLGLVAAPLANVITYLINHAETEKRLSHLNTYLTVSSLLAQPLDLHELLEAALYSCMQVVTAEAASVLLLDDEKENFRFYQVEGSAKPILMAATFPADRGLAGSVLQTQRWEIVNNVQSDPRFYEQIDSESGFETRSMIAVPLIAGEEQVGVLEVLNKEGGALFTAEEGLLLVSVAEEIAFAIRNAKVFEYVVNTYCKQRQGQRSCRGCQRPLGSWTPCVKYREASV